MRRNAAHKHYLNSAATSPASAQSQSMEIARLRASHTSASPPPTTCPALLLSVGAAEKLPRGAWQARQLRVVSGGLLGATQKGRPGVRWGAGWGSGAGAGEGLGTQPLCPSGEKRPFYLPGSSGTEKLPIITQIADFCHPNCERGNRRKVDSCWVNYHWIMVVRTISGAGARIYQNILIPEQENWVWHAERLCF